MNLFRSAIPIYPKGKEGEMNFSSIYVFDFPKKDKSLLRISGNSSYSLYLNGRFIGYGPARAAKSKFRVDEIPLSYLRSHNRLVVILRGYNCHSFHHMDSLPFLSLEVENKAGVIAKTSLSTKAYLDIAYQRKVARFSYQREYSENYSYDSPYDFFLYGQPINLPILEVKEQKEKDFIPRGVLFPSYESLPFVLMSRCYALNSPKKEKHDDRYFHLEYLKIFSLDSWESDANALASQLEFSEKRHVGKENYPAYLYRLPSSRTGFIQIDIIVKKQAEILIGFDEVMEEKKDGFPQIDPFRNATQNIVLLQLKAGHYRLQTHEPYIVQYLFLTVLKGDIGKASLGLRTFENDDRDFASFKMKDRKIQRILEAGAASFRQNAVDILTDCPSRERAGWLFDSYYTGRSERFLTGKNLVERNFLENYADYKAGESPIPDKMIPMCYPGDHPDGNYIPNWALYYVLELANYLRRNDDPTLKEKSLSKVSNLVSFFAEYENEFGLLENLDKWVFIEWSPENDQEHIVGVNVPSNAVYSQFLIEAGRILGDESLIARGEGVKRILNKMAFNGSFFVDNLIRDESNKLIQTNFTGETTQYYCFYFDITSPSERPDLWRRLLDDFGPNRPNDNPYQNVYPSAPLPGNFLRLELLLRFGYPDKLIDEAVSYFGKMAEITGTLWEHASIFASLNHGFTSFADVMLIKAITGIREVDDKNKIVRIAASSYDEEYLIRLPLGNGKKITASFHDGKRRIHLPKDYRLIKE